jgi:hypothetical protein
LLSQPLLRFSVRLAARHRIGCDGLSPGSQDPAS